MDAQPIAMSNDLSDRMVPLLNRYKWPFLVIILPALLSAAFLYGIVADQYISEAHFLVKKAEEGPAMPTGIGQALSLVGGVTEGHGEAASVSDYLTSMNVVERLRKDVDLITIFRRPEADFFSRLWHADPEDEELVKYYRDQVSVKLDSSTGIVTVRARAFRPTDSRLIVQSLLRAGEERVNELNQRAYDSSLAYARKQMAEAETGVVVAQSALTGFRQASSELDPAASGEAQIKIVSGVTETLVQARAALTTMGATISHTSPQYIALEQKIRALEGQQAAEAAVMTRHNPQSRSIAQNLGTYEQLKVKQDLAVKRYALATADLQKATDRAEEKRIFLVPVVDANLPEKPLYPERGRIVLTILGIMAVVYCIGWLLVAGVREHAA